MITVFTESAPTATSDNKLQKKCIGQLLMLMSIHYDDALTEKAGVILK